MSLELPGAAVVAFNMVGLPWPGLDEDVLRAWARDLRAFSAQVTDSSGRSRTRVAAMAGDDPSPPAKRLLAHWDHYHGVVSDLRGPMEAFAGALDVAADAVVAQKGVVIAAAVALAAEVVATQGEALVTFGLAEAEVPAEVAVARLMVKGALQYLEAELLAKLVGAGCSELGGHLGKAVSALVSGGGQVAVEAWSLKAAYDQGTLQSLGSALTKNQSDTEAAGAGSQRLAFGRQLATGGPGGGWREVAVAVEQAVLRVLAQLFRDLVHALRSVVDDTLMDIKSMVSQLERMDAERPAEDAAVTGGAKLTGDGEPTGSAAGLPGKPGERPRETEGQTAEQALASLPDDAQATLGDGAWIGKENGQRLYLSPEQNAAAEAALNRAAAAEPGITSEMQSVTNSLKEEIPDAKLVGPDAGVQLKSAFSFKRKMCLDLEEVPNPDPHAVASGINDAVRYTVEVPPDQYADGVNRAADQLKEGRFQPVKTKDFWEINRGAGRYKGINSTWRDPATGQTFELQFHTPGSLSAKEAAHPYYEVERLPDTTAAQQQEALSKAAEIFGSVQEPPGLERIKPW